ncbi:B3/B4 domain-containing protein [Nesterenkonia lutea]|uniref:DNA/RNA-binding domain of Phe-tRNA-synthetase-like protein n=1 Tax=Nesterenkonia lutea TaxID=272919 RepID=A0ABR9JG90_9MICC|nr:phenylalanine--tRNA ligase beta subunit-related protein [Nesterenkonia lutea]MBE1524948.1 DNA/RNA-binding domain of Phe-tRNA-synthetase-like protein [Nesterenkonia lutea]
MPESTDDQKLLAAAHVDDAVFDLRPDYQALLLIVEGIVPGASDESSEALLSQAEASTAQRVTEGPIEELEHVAAWREAYRAFGAKPQRTRNSLEALTRRAETGLPRVNRLTDIYNAISVLHQIPLGGEDLAGYVGAPHLVRASGEEPFEVTSDGEPSLEYPKPGEVIWRDDAGVTCRRWNWRQGPRTQLTAETTQALFILDALAPVTIEDLTMAADALVQHLSDFSPNLRTSRRIISAETTGQTRL